MRVTLVPASNKTSTAAIRWLLSQDTTIQIQGLYRDLKKVPNEFRSAGNFTAVQGDVADASTLNFTKSNAVIMVLPPAYDGRDIVAHSRLISNNIKNAIENSGTVKRLVLLSSLGAEFAKGVGELKTNHISEEILQATNTPEIIFIRAAYFMENWTMSLETLKAPEPFFYSTITPLDFKVAMVAVKDIGQALAEQAIRDWKPPKKPYVCELHGPQPYTPLDVQETFSQVLKKDVQVKAVEKDELKGFFGQIFAPQIVDEWVEMTRSFLPGGIAEKDLSKPSDVDVIRGETTLKVAFESATAEMK
ncbi:uncharacterized protein B0J16DRAFT_178067 [Fusarium flagelliforme]|uniref:uncharacterized protein n=1 Tax=Fusarium flagelliforme TaxID=2675880 RepID=UPI001E8DF2CB|nr:uncharacterized protein B0J16DRAFT_178067 [Fusarium flagelliforme]KAH7179859.1 hypothetical protein B0J16DRAFT_178067 [Fusarium flagelliforme]